MNKNIPTLEQARARIAELEANVAVLREALEPLARLKIPERVTYNAAAYSIFFEDIRRARAALESEDEMGWNPIETAPRDGRPFLAYCIDRPPFDPAPGRFYDVAKWSGKTPDDRTGHFASRSGAIVTHWMHLPPPPEE